MSCRINTNTHRLDDRAVRLLKSEDSKVRVNHVKPHSLQLFVQELDDQNSDQASTLYHAHHVIRSFLVALNAASLGFFYWADEPWVHPIMHQSEGVNGAVRSLSALVTNADEPTDDLRSLTDLEVQNAIIIFGVLGRERHPHLEIEYAKGLLLLRMNFCEVNFRREAFPCFYRALENFIATRILKVKKRQNEVRDLQQGLDQIGASRDIVDELKEVYRIRSSQVAHAQIAPRDVPLDDVLKTKTFVDFVMHKTSSRHSARPLAFVGVFSGSFVQTVFHGA
jgi:hypothetical protein